MTDAQLIRLSELHHAEHALVRSVNELLSWLCLLEWARLGGKPEDVYL